MCISIVIQYLSVEPCFIRLMHCMCLLPGINSVPGMSKRGNNYTWNIKSCGLTASDEDQNIRTRQESQDEHNIL